MRTSFRAALAIGILVVVPAASFGATFTLAPQVTAVYDLSGNAVSSPALGAGPLVYKIDFAFTIAGLPQQDGGVKGVAFDVDLTSGLTIEQGGWHADTSTFDVIFPSSISGPIWTFNQDIGPSSADLKGIAALTTIESPLHRYDPRTTLGQSSPAEIGSIYIEWDGLTSETLSLSDVQYLPYFRIDPRTYLNDVDVTDQSAIDFEPMTGITSDQLAVPEPASLGVLCASVLALRRRRQVRVMG